MKKVAITICSDEYLNYYKVHKSSLHYLGQDWDHILYNVKNYEHLKAEYKYSSMVQFICAIRPKIVLETFKRGYDTVLFLGSDVVFYGHCNVLNKVLDLNRDQVIATPHIISPIPDDGLFPSTESIIKTGHLNSDFVLWKKTKDVIKFLEWQDNIHKTKCIEAPGIFLDQNWLNCLPFFINNVYILKDKSYNMAYWNLHERNFDKYYKSNRITCFQFSGFDVNNLSKHQNRIKPVGLLKEFLENYNRNCNASV